MRLLEQCGAIPSTHDYHINRFLFEQFPRGMTYAAADDVPPLIELPTAAALAFSIDEVTTTEIDDAFSVTQTATGRMEVGIHIAAPALGIAAGSRWIARPRGVCPPSTCQGARSPCCPRRWFRSYHVG